MLAPESFDLADIRTQRRILSIFNKTEGLAGISNQVLLRLMALSKLRKGAPKGQLWRAGEEATSAWVILQGAVAVAGVAAETDVASNTAIGVASVLHKRPWTSTGSALTEVVALEIPQAALHILAESSTALRRALRHASTQLGHPSPQVIEDRDKDCVEWVASCLPPGWPESAFVRKLATVWSACVHDKLTIVVVDPGHTGPPERESGDVPTIRVRADEAVLGDAKFAAAVGIAEQSYLLLDTGLCSPNQRAAWRQRCEKAIVLADGNRLGDTRGLRDSVVRVPCVRVPGAVGPLAANSVRIRFDTSDLTGTLSDNAKAGLQRLARSASDRTIGLALGGGGAWGYAHIALIRAILARDVPIDMVSGVSFGAMVGAYYCANGPAGMDVLEARGSLFHRVLPVAMASSRIIGWLAENDLGRIDLDDFEVPFFPVATDVAHGNAVAILGQRMGYGVRASGSFPGVFSPTTGRDPITGVQVRYVDGGIRDNVPEAALLAAGADLLVASNIVPLPAPVVPPPPMFDTHLGRMAHELNPIGRVRDLWRSTFILFHAAGETGTLSADVVYNSKPNQFLATSFNEARNIVLNAEEEVAPVADELARRWKAMIAQGN